MSELKKVCLFNFRPMEDFHGYRIDTLEPVPYLRGYSTKEILLGYLTGRRVRTWVNPLGLADDVDRMYRERDPGYMRLMGDFVDRFKDHDLIVMSTYNFVHPEILAHELKKPVKVLGFIDDPLSTYVRGVPYLWAFDAAFYISPGYSERILMPEALEQWGCERHYWFPLAPYLDKPETTEQFFRDRTIDLVYVGSVQGSKVNKLAKLKRHFGDRLRVHGRWPHKGYYGFTRALAGKPLYPWRVTALSEPEKTALYRRVKIGINMHVSERPMETGNMRMYEVPAHGMMLLCDQAGRNAHERIFKPGIEAVYYKSVEDAIEKAEHYLAHDEERVAIARGGFERVWRDYVWEENLLRFLEWAIRLPKRAHRSGGA